MNPPINLIPATTATRAAIGQSVAIRLQVQHADGTAYDLAPYAITAPFSPVGAVAPPVPEWTITIAGSDITLSLTDEQTAEQAPAGSITWHWCVWADDGVQRLLFARGDLGLMVP